jgi:hypothetical protein
MKMRVGPAILCLATACGSGGSDSAGASGGGPPVVADGGGAAGSSGTGGPAGGGTAGSSGAGGSAGQVASGGSGAGPLTGGAGGSTGGSGGVGATAAAGVQAFAAAICAQAVSCGCPGVSTQDGCAASVSYRYLDWFAGKAVAYDAACVSKTIAAVNSLGCDGRGGLDVGCTILAGTGSIGAVCTPTPYNADCKSGLSCIVDRSTVRPLDGGIDAAGIRATCQPVMRNLGESCGLYQSCVSGLYCNTDTCAPMLAQGAVCSTGTWSGTCAAGLYCGQSSHACTPIPGRGAPCETVCDQGLYCDSASKTCAPLLAQGAVCMTVTGTVWSGLCADGPYNCVELSGETAFTCHPPKGYGDACDPPNATADLRCPDLACSNGKCAKAPPYICSYVSAY